MSVSLKDISPMTQLNQEYKLTTGITRGTLDTAKLLIPPP